MPFNFDQTPERRSTNSVKWTWYPPDVLPLWVADMDFPAPPPIIEALRAAVEHGVFGYELPSLALRESVAARMQKLYNWNIHPESVVAIPGLVSGFYAAASALCRPGDGYLIQPPVYMPFNDIQKHLGVIRQEAQLVARAQDSRLLYELDWTGFRAAFHTDGSRTRMFLLCSPHNPTGQIYTPDELTRMAETCLQQNTVIVSDEIHSELLLGPERSSSTAPPGAGGSAQSHTPIASLSPEIAENSITLVAPSKTFNIAGLFCGFAIIPSPKLRAQYKLQLERMTLHPNGLGQVAALAAFSGACDGWLAELNAYLTANRDFAVQYIEQELPGIRTTVPDATYLLWLDCSELVKNGKIPEEFSPYEFFLQKAKVALNDGVPFGSGGENFVRLNFGCSRSTLEDGLERMKKALV
jgi:cystathionine beta-lyase